ncbi:hypothetical protein EXIGLDRAFT_772138 [Exidia glandulosa HHB12029]|uniref:Uncharacterized protein n=1 Tax=Exidia glandulosa HHB12029 TaxID=1314781 RepID=A0A165FIL7_EXIGL|nr:hypothetical protein EXIGLDRAFT_772138 [Exidia glandulosa HHB12029]
MSNSSVSSAPGATDRALNHATKSLNIAKTTLEVVSNFSSVNPVAKVAVDLALKFVERCAAIQELHTAYKEFAELVEDYTLVLVSISVVPRDDHQTGDAAERRSATSLEQDPLPGPAMPDVGTNEDGARVARRTAAKEFQDRVVDRRGDDDIWKDMKAAPRPNKHVKVTLTALKRWVSCFGVQRVAPDKD